MTSSPAFALDLAARSCVGVGDDVRAENQDNFLIIDADGSARYLRDQAEQRCQVPGWPAGHVRVAVLDGMGGHGHGREAAEAAVAGLLAVPACTTVEALGARLDALHLALQHDFARAGDARRPGTTLTLLDIPPAGPALLYHVGDSRLYAVGPATIAALTVDHVPATACAMAGLMDEAAWWRQVHGEHRPQISQAFILGNAFGTPAILSDPLLALTPANLPAWLAPLHDRRAVALHADTLYLLATDGFWSCAGAQAWIARWPQLLAGAGGAAGALARLFTEMAQHPPPALHPDNLTAVALRVGAARGMADETALPAASDASGK